MWPDPDAPAYTTPYPARPRFPPAHLEPIAREIATVRGSVATVERSVVEVKDSVEALARALPDARGVAQKLDTLGGRIEIVVADLDKLPALVEKRSAYRPPYEG